MPCHAQGLDYTAIRRARMARGIAKCLHHPGSIPLALPLSETIWIQERVYQPILGEFYGPHAANKSEYCCELVSWEQVGAFLGIGMLVAGRSLAASKSQPCCGWSGLSLEH